jgi:hypothetical protein
MCECVAFSSKEIELRLKEFCPSLCPFVASFQDLYRLGGVVMSRLQHLTGAEVGLEIVLLLT